MTLDFTVIAQLSESLIGSGLRVTTVAPATGVELATIQHSTAADVAAAGAIARKAQIDWAATSVENRAKPFIRYHDRILTDKVVLDLIQAETGKARSSAFEEVLDSAGVALYYGRQAPKFLAPKQRAGAVPFATRTTEHHHAKGIVGVISPWNAPLSLGSADIIPALLAGNAVIHKPDSQTALTALRARDVLEAAGLPRDLWQIVVGKSSEIGRPIIDSVDHVCFTGSTNAGKTVAKQAAGRLISCTLELGGKNPMIVLDDADVDKAAKGAVRACFGHAGQLCIAIERIYVASSRYDEFVEKFRDNVRELRIGFGYDYSVDFGSLINQSQLDTATRHVDDAVSKGARVVTGGHARPDLGPYFFEPTVLDGVTSEMALFSEETFGPVVSIYRFEGEDQAIELANATEYGLNASIWTRDTARGNRLGARIQSGAVNINEGYGSAYASNDAPMGGMKTSGIGRRHGEHGLLEYTEAQTIASQHIIGFDPLPFLTAEQNVTFLTMTYQALKALRLK